MRTFGKYKKLTKSNVARVLRNMAEQCDERQEDAQVYAEELERILNSLSEEDFFGTEAQCDPRGDRRVRLLPSPAPRGITYCLPSL